MMAEDSVPKHRKECYGLLLELRKTVEELLANHCCNVWNIPGGLNRLFKPVLNVMKHRFQNSGNDNESESMWNFVKGLRRLNPILYPYIAQLSRSNAIDEEDTPLSHVWLKQSLLNHTLCMQLRILSSDRNHLLFYYEDGAFLTHSHYFEAMMTCLKAVEENNSDVLNNINLTLINFINNEKPSKPYIRERSISMPSLNCLRKLESCKMKRNCDLMTSHIKPHITHCCNNEFKFSNTSCITVKNAFGSTPNMEYSCKDIANDSWTTEPLLNLKIECCNKKRTNTIHKSRSLSLSNMTFTNENCSIPHQYMTTPRLMTLSNQNKFSNQNESNSLLDEILNEEDDFNKPRSTVYNLTTTNAIRNLENNGNAFNSANYSLSQDSGISSLHLGDSLVNSPSSNTQHLNSYTTNKPIWKTHRRACSDFMLSKNKVSNLDKTTNRLSRSQNTSFQNLSVNQKLDPHSQEEKSRCQYLLENISREDLKTCEELDKENAHFEFAEKIISAIEVDKYTKSLTSSCLSDSSFKEDEGDVNSKQMVRIRPTNCSSEKSFWFSDMLDDGEKTNCNSIHSSASSFSFGNSFLSDEDFPETEITDSTEIDSLCAYQSNLSSMKQSGLSLSLASCYSEAEILKVNAQKSRKSFSEYNDAHIERNESGLSADYIAINLLKQFSKTKIPKPEEIDWLVSEKDAPQALLPLPNSFPVSPGGGENADLELSNQKTRIRGNLEWAPPRKQIISTIQIHPKRKVALAKQNNRCAGCGAKVEPGYMKRFKYCDYLGKYFCPRCHTNKTALIPGRILHKWDFKERSISNFSYDLLKSEYDNPFFNVMDINPTLYYYIPDLDDVRQARIQLAHLKIFLQACRLGKTLFDAISTCPIHWITTIDGYAIAELYEIKKKKHLSKMSPLVENCISHIKKCLLCQAKGHICEICNNGEDIIFPFELNKVVQCLDCQGSFHRKCFRPAFCPKCFRRNSRFMKSRSDEFNQKS